MGKSSHCAQLIYMQTSFKFRWLKVLALAVASTVALQRPGRAVERVTLKYPPLRDFSISVSDLEQFANEGKVAPQFSPFLKQATPAQVQQFRQYLQERLVVSPLYIKQFTNSPLVDGLLERLGTLLQGDNGKNGKRLIRTALINAAADNRQGLTPINFLRRFPGRELNVNVNEGFATYANLTNLLTQRDATIATLNRLASAQASTEQTDPNKLDLRQVGRYQWRKRSFDWVDRARQRHVPGDLYLPQSTSTAGIPLIIISHGVAEDRTALSYLAQHLASHGFAVAAIEHVGGDANRFRQYFSGLAPAPSPTEFYNRPRDLSFLIDELQRQARVDPSIRQLDLQRVGAIGHSLGGYTTFAIAGARIDFDRVEQLCSPNRSVNLSTVLQCRAKELPPKRYALQDPRIVAIFAVNPIGNVMFGPSGLSRVKVPTMIVAGSDDLVAPAVPEQVYPFTWLQTANKYLATIEDGTHFSVLTVSKTDSVFPISDDLIGPDPEIARGYTKALSLAFFETHLANRPEFRTYLSAAYAEQLVETARTRGVKHQPKGRVSPSLNLVRSSASDQLVQMLDRTDERATKPSQ